MLITIPGGAAQLSGNPIWIRITGAVFPEGATRKRILCKVVSIDSVLVGSPFIDDCLVTTETEALFDISGRVNQPMQPQFEWPLVSAVKAYIDAAWNIQIISGIAYVDSSGNLQTSFNDADAEEIQIIKGGISEQQLGEYNDANTTFFKEVIETGKFLTTQPNNAEVAPNQPIKLYLISPYAENTNATLTITGRYADGTLSEPFVQVFELFLDGLFELNVMPSHVGIAMVNTAGSLLAGFDVEVENANDANLHESRTYRINNNYFENSNFLFVANSRSGVDVIWLNGAVEKSIDITGTEGIRQKGIGAGSRTATIVTTSRSGRRKWKINTGYKSLAEMEAMVDVYLSKDIWLLNAGKLIPVKLANAEQLLSDSMQDVHSASLELVEAHHTRFA